MIVLLQAFLESLSRSLVEDVEVTVSFWLMIDMGIQGVKVLWSVFLALVRALREYFRHFCIHML